MAVDEIKAEDVKAQKTAILMMDEQWPSDEEEESPTGDKDEFEKQQLRNEQFVKSLISQHFPTMKVDVSITQKWLDTYIPLLHQLLQ